MVRHGSVSGGFPLGTVPNTWYFFQYHLGWGSKRTTETEFSSVSYSNQAVYDTQEREGGRGGIYSNDGGKKEGPGFTSFC